MESASVKIANMNWVEKRANKERAIRLNGKEIYLDLVRAMDSAVQTFKERYRGVKDLAPVERLAPPDGSFSVTKTIKTHNGAIWVEEKLYFVCEFKDDESMRIQLRGSASPQVGFTIDADENGRVFLRETAGDHAEKSIEEASREILEQFLFG
jgi:hypothetical protein